MAGMDFDRMAEEIAEAIKDLTSIKTTFADGSTSTRPRFTGPKPETIKTLLEKVENECESLSDKDKSMIRQILKNSNLSEPTKAYLGKIM